MQKQRLVNRLTIMNIILQKDAKSTEAQIFIGRSNNSIKPKLAQVSIKFGIILSGKFIKFAIILLHLP